MEKTLSSALRLNIERQVQITQFDWDLCLFFFSASGSGVKSVKS